ncbi:hypothetical protein ACJZ2D_009963 [Fusarium nematophilum]
MKLILVQKFLQEGLIRFKEFHRHNAPPYAILSHTWEEGQEVTYSDCSSSSSCAAIRNKRGYEKIRNTCLIAAGDGIEYVWIDTCCIDKCSSAELSEAINSMFQWYQRAKVCYAFLSDLDDISMLGACRWFSRGWTLQELIAPKVMEFFNSSWDPVGDKSSLAGQLSLITRIEVHILHHRAPVSSECVAKRFSWAAGRETSREEDMAYCLMGLFDINMPLLYGEGAKAFIRLQEEIIKSTHDLSIFAWQALSEATTTTTTTGGREEYCGFLAKSPRAFFECSTLSPYYGLAMDESEMAVTNKGIQLRAPNSFYREEGDGALRYCLKLDCWDLALGPFKLLAVPMRMAGPNTFVRARRSAGSTLVVVDDGSLNYESRKLTLLTKAKATTTTVSRLSGAPPITWTKQMVLVKRFSAVRMHIPDDLAPKQREPLAVAPLKCWDLQDHTFFSPDPSTCWGALCLDCGVLFVCFWSFAEFEGTVLSAKGKVGMELKRQLLVLGERLDYRHPEVREILQMHEAEYHDSVRVEGADGRRLEVSFRFERAADQDISLNKLWEVYVERKALGYSR